MRVLRDDPEDEAHEALCRRCGASCHAAIPVNGLPVVVPGIHCRYLVEEAPGRFACSVYERRLEVAPWCHTAAEAAARGLLEQTCPYARGIPGYRGKVRLSPRLLLQVLPAVREELRRRGAPGWVSPEGCLRVLQEGAGGVRWTVRHDPAAEGPDGRLYFSPVDENEKP